MNRTNYNSAKPLFIKADAIDKVQANVALTGSKIKIQVLDADNNLKSDQPDLIAALGQTAYNTLVAGVKTSLSSSLTSEETSNNTAIAAL